MAYTVTQYREEFVAAFEQDYSILRAGTTRETVLKGNVATFLVAGSGGEVAVTRGVNGQIPFSSPSNTQVSVTLKEKHAPQEMTGFDIFTAQGDQRRIMQSNSRSILNRDIDQAIIDQLDTATVNAGTAARASLDLVVHARTLLASADVKIWDENKMFAVISPAFEGYMMQVSEFANANYVDVKVFNGPAKQMRRWMGVNWSVHANLTGNGTSLEKCYMWHADALGHAANTAEMVVDAGYERKQQVSWTNATLYHNAVLLQNAGICQMKHDGSAYA